MSRTIDDIAAQLRANKENRKGESCVLLIGAGCSLEAGIPGAWGFIEEIKKRHYRKWESASEKTYPACMAQLTSNERHKLISDFIDSAKINWAHVAIAQLMAGGFVDRVLTTNFDPLVMRAAALFNIFPAVYDMITIGEEYRASWVRDRAVFHLHGQRDGFFQAHTEQHVNALEAKLGNLFRDCTQHRTWIVVGYSGANDPVFRQLEKMPEFDNDLYWVSYKTEGMPDHLEQLVGQGKGAYWINDDLGADNFLYQLADRAGCPPPPFFMKPFSHLRQTLDQIASFTLPGQESALPVTAEAVAKIDKAITCIEPSLTCAVDGTTEKEAKPDLIAKAKSLIMAGHYDEILGMAEDLRAEGSTSANTAQAWAYVMKGVNLFSLSRTRKHSNAILTINEAISNYKKALEIMPNMVEAWNNWGAALIELSRHTKQNESEKHKLQAEEKFLCANKIKPGWSSYNLACLAALQGHKKQCKAWLEDRITYGRLPTRSHMQNDKDLDSVRNEPWFADILAQAKE